MSRSSGRAHKTDMHVAENGVPSSKANQRPSEGNSTEARKEPVRWGKKRRQKTNYGVQTMKWSMLV